MKSIVAVDQNWAIGCQGQMLFHLPPDLDYFRTLTEGKVVVMGRLTYVSLPSHARPLPNRTNIVLSRRLSSELDNPKAQGPEKQASEIRASEMQASEMQASEIRASEMQGIKVCRDLNELVSAVEGYAMENIWVIGGQKVYTDLLPYCSHAYVTKVESSAPTADTFYPNLDELGNWYLESDTELQNYKGLHYKFCLYKNRSVKPLKTIK